MPVLRYFAFLVLSLTFAAAQAPQPPGTPATPAPAVPAPTAPPIPAVPSVPAVPSAPTKPGPSGTTKPGPAGATKTPSGGPGKVPGALPAAPAGPLVPSRKPVRDPNVPLGDTKIVEPIEQASLKGSELAVLYRKYTGRRVIVSAAAAAAEFSFVQDASAEDPLTYSQAAELLRKAAGIENFVFMPDDKDPNLDFLTVSTRLPGLAYNVFNENDQLPEGEGVISYVMTFKHLKPETAAQAFTQIIGQFGTYGSIAPLNGSVVITENTSLIRRLIKLKEEIDKPADVTSTRFISVKFADVTELAGTLNDLLNTQQQAQKTAAVQRAGTPAAPVAPGAPPQNAAALNAGAATSTDTPVQIIPEPRTNRIFGMGRPVDLLFVEGLIREFDIETSEKTFLRRKLKFLTVSDFLPIASDALNRAFTSTGDSGGGGAVGGAAGSANRSNNRSGSNTGSNTGSRTGSTGSNGSSRTSSTNNNSSFGGGNSSFGGMGGSSGTMGGSGASLGNPNATSAPESRLVGRTLLVADNITNSIVVQGPPSGLEIIERLLDQVDVKADQVMISTVIGQLTLDDSKTFGADYVFNHAGSTALRGGGGSSPDMPILPIVSTPAGGTASTSTTYSPGSQSGGTGGLQVY
ncbi:MAG: secretin N-terminal domain-containing protein, partial [Verrucomicrobiota bacterium]